jgi:CBS domain-containing protein
MPVFKLVRRVKFPATAVWPVISDVVGFGELSPNLSRCEIISGERVGMRRRNWDADNRMWDEICIEWIDGRSYTMLVDTGDYPYPYLKMQRTLSLEERSGDVLIGLEYMYKPKYGLVGKILDRLVGRSKLEKTAERLLENIVRRIRDRVWAYSVTVQTILAQKGNSVLTVKPEQSVGETARLLYEKRIGSVLALRPDGSIAGVVSERDIVRGIAKFGPQVLDHPVTDIMTSKIIVCSLSDDMVNVMACMTDRRVRHLPVLDGDTLVGIISIGDVVKARMADLESESESLREYIAGREWRELYLHGAAVGANPFAVETKPHGDARRIVG